MFNIYGLTGRLASGPLEDIHKVLQANRTPRSRAVEPLGQDPELHRRPGPAPGAGTGTGGAHAPGVQAYTQMAQPRPGRSPLTHVGQVMSHTPYTLPHTTTLGQAWAALLDHQVGQAPVVDGHGQLVGLVRRVDLMTADALGPHPDSPPSGAFWQYRPVSEVMFTPVPATRAEADLRHVTQLLLRTGLPGLPVVDEAGRVVGFVSRSDILRAVSGEPPLDLWG